MSYRMYNFRTPKDTFFWEVCGRIQKDYLENYPYALAWREVVTETDAGVELFKIQDEFVKHSVEMQIFDEGDTFLLRILTYGYDHWHLSRYEAWGVEPVFYDDRSDVPPEDQKNKAVADWIDPEIKALRYFTIPLLPDHFFDDVLIDAMVKKQEEKNASAPRPGNS